MRALNALVAVVVAHTTAARAAPSATIDDAFPPRIAIEPPYSLRVGKVTLDVRATPEVSWLTVELIGRAPTGDAIWLDLPAGTQIAGMALRLDRGAVWSRPVAVDRVGAAVRGADGTAVLAWDSSSADQDHLALRVDGAGTIELALVLPAVSRLVVSPGMRRLEIVVNGARTAALEAPRDLVDVPIANITLGAGPHAIGRLDAATALVAVASSPEIIVRSIATSVERWSPDKPTLRRVMKGAIDRMRHCWLRVAQRDPRVEGTTTLRFEIVPDGTVETATSDGALPDEVTSCLTADVRTWVFPPGDSRVVVYYPLTFKLNR